MCVFIYIYIRFITGAKIFIFHDNNLLFSRGACVKTQVNHTVLSRTGFTISKPKTILGKIKSSELVFSNFATQSNYSHCNKPT